MTDKIISRVEFDTLTPVAKLQLVREGWQLFDTITRREFNALNLIQREYATSRGVKIVEESPRP